MRDHTIVYGSLAANQLSLQHQVDYIPSHSGIDERISSSMKHKKTLPTTRLNPVKLNDPKRNDGAAVLPVYEMPRILTYTDKQILEVLGPAQTNVYP